MRFLLHIRTQLPGEWTPEQRGDILQRETEAAVALMQRGVLRRIFRIVGQQASFSIWEADTLEELHAVLESLPLYRFMALTEVLVHGAAPLKTGGAFEVDVRQTQVWVRHNGKWLILHEHNSVPTAPLQ